MFFLHCICKMKQNACITEWPQQIYIESLRTLFPAVKHSKSSHQISCGHFSQGHFFCFVFKFTLDRRESLIFQTVELRTIGDRYTDTRVRRSREERLNRLLYYHLFTVMIISNRKPSKSKKYLKKADTLNHVVDTAGDTVMVSNLK